MMGEVVCDLIKPDDGSLRLNLLQRKLGNKKRDDYLPQLSARHVPVGGHQLLLLRVENTTMCCFDIKQMKVALSDPTQAVLDLEHPDCYNDTRDKDTFEIDSMEDLDEENYKNLRIEGPKSGLPFSLQPLESQTAIFKVVIKETLEYNYTLELDLQASLMWSLHGDKHTEISLYKLPSLRIRKPGMIIHAAPQTRPKSKNSFQVKYTIINYLQDFLSVKLLWLPKKALKDPKLSEAPNKKSAVSRVINSVLCSQPETNLGAMKLGSTVSVLIDFTIQDHGIYELGEHMKLNMQYAMATHTEPPMLPSKLSFTHHRRGSSSSTHSMPTDTLTYSDNTPQKGHRVQVSRSAGISPVCGLHPGVPSQLLVDGDRKKGIEASVQSLSSVPTPGSPHKGYGMSAVSTSPTFLKSRSVLPGTFTAAISRTPSNSSIASLSRTTPTTLSALHILKRNCQVLVDASTP